MLYACTTVSSYIKAFFFTGCEVTILTFAILFSKAMRRTGIVGQILCTRDSRSEQLILWYPNTLYLQLISISSKKLRNENKPRERSGEAQKEKLCYIFAILTLTNKHYT